MAKRDNEKIWDLIEAIAVDSKAEADELYDYVENLISNNYDKKSPQKLISLAEQRTDQSMNTTRKIVQDGFDEVILEMQDALAENYDIKLTKANISAMSEMESSMLENVTITSEALKTSVKGVLLQNIGKGISFNQMVNGLKEMYPAYSQHIYTVVNTGLQDIYKQANWAKMEEAGFEYFIYAGPKDEKNRPYCAEHVGKVYTMEEAQAIQAEINTFYNCRHSLDPITKEEYEAKK